MPSPSGHGAALLRHQAAGADTVAHPPAEESPGPGPPGPVSGSVGVCFPPGSLPDAEKAAGAGEGGHQAEGGHDAVQGVPAAPQSSL